MLAFNHPLELEKSIPGAQKDIGRWSRKIKTTPIKSSTTRLLMGTKKRLNPIICCFPLISLILRPLTLKSVKKKSKKEVI